MMYEKISEYRFCYNMLSIYINKLILSDDYLVRTLNTRNMKIMLDYLLLSNY